MSGEAFVVFGAGHAPIKHRFPPSGCVQLPVGSAGPEERWWAAETGSIDVVQAGGEPWVLVPRSAEARSGQGG